MAINSGSSVENELGELLDRVGRFARGVQYVEGLKPAQWEALRYVARANRYSRSPSALASFLGATKGTISQTLITLEGKGYVQRTRGPSDGRAVRLELTPAGHDLLERDPLSRIETVAATTLEDDTRDNLIGMLGKVIDGLQRACGNGEFGVCVDCCLFCQNGAEALPNGPHRCGLNGEALDDVEATRLCVNYRAAS